QSRQGDHAAFTKLIREHQHMVHSLTYRMTGSVADCKDLAQETFIRAYQQLDSFQGTAKFSSWLCRIAVNACLDWQKRERRRPLVHADWVADNVNQPVEADDAGAGHELGKRVQEALLKLPEKQRAAIVLTTYHGHNHAEAARILGCSETTVSWRIFSARKKLKKILADLKGGTHD
ncbi:MAG TPA: RNA polymerase sigma factor, partial [Candidatus Sulfotelmatobacter sp.]|nr:RNA polymerase sigma factor [Candidatus Sulfotelmatobacter sp.]